MEHYKGEKQQTLTLIISIVWIENKTEDNKNTLKKKQNLTLTVDVMESKKNYFWKRFFNFSVNLIDHHGLAGRYVTSHLKVFGRK